jgi:hypothetical protein
MSVLAGGYKLGGAKFTVPMESPRLVTVGAQPWPLPLASVRIKIFNDNNGTNGEWDEVGEDGLAGFRGHISDVLDEVGPAGSVPGSGQEDFDAFVSTRTTQIGP